MSQGAEAIGPRGEAEPESGGWAEAVVDRSQWEASTSARCLVSLDPALMAAMGLTAGAVVEITTDHGRRALGRIAQPLEEDRGSGAIRLDRLMRQAIKAKLNDRVRLAPCALEPARRVVLAAPIDVSRAHNLIEHLTELMAESRTPCLEGMKIYASFHGSYAGTVYEVTEVVDAPAEFTPETELEIEPPGARAEEGAFDVGFEDVGGLRQQLVLMRELVQLPLQLPFVYRQLGISPPRGVILYGPPGSGKTHLAKAIANDINARFYFINGPAVVGTMQGETESNIRRIFNEAAHHAPSLIFIDELDAIAPHRGQSGSQSDIRAVTTLLSLMDGLQRVDGVVIIGTTNRIEAIDVALRRPGRFDREVFIGPPDAEGRLEILEIHTREMPLTEAAIDYLPKVAKVTHGFVGADLMELCREAGLNALRRNRPLLSDHLGAFRVDGPLNIEVDAEDFAEAQARMSPSALREALVSIPEVDWEDIGGLDELKWQLRGLVERPLLEPHAFRAMGLSGTPGVLLHGPPGTGKTMLAHALANSSRVNFIEVAGPEIFSKWLGESEETVRHIFKVARQLAPAIICLDELDSIAPPRGSDIGSKATERVVSQLLIELDALRSVPDIVVIATTNRIDLVDPALLRPGRLGTHFQVPLPDRKARESILARVLAGANLGESLSAAEAAAAIAARTDGFSGAELREVVERAGRFSLLRDRPAIESAELGEAVDSILSSHPATPHHDGEG